MIRGLILILRNALEQLDEAIDSLEKNVEQAAHAPAGRAVPQASNETWRRQTVARLDTMIARIETVLQQGDALPAAAGE